MKGKKILSVFLSLAMMLSLLIFGGTNFTAEELKNLISNPGFEEGVLPWVQWGGYELAEGSEARTGSKSLEAVPNTNTYGGAALFLHDILNEYGPGDYTITFYAKAKTDGFALRLLFNGAGLGNKPITNSSWTFFTFSFTMNVTYPDNPTILIQPIPASSWHLGFYLDDFTLTKAGVYEPTPTPEPTATPTPEAIPAASLSKEDGGNFIVSISPWNVAYRYQIWTYQETESEIFGGEGTTNEWHLSLPYTLGSDRTAEGFTEDGDAITRNIGSFASVDKNYTIAVRVIDGSGNFVGQYKDTYTQAEVGEVVINKVEVDGAYADERAQVKEITNGATVSMMVYGNGVEGTVFSARVDTTGEVIAPLVESPNAFEWSIGLLAPGNYSVTLTAATATSSDSRTVNFRLYKNDPAIVYGELTGLEVAGLSDSVNYQVDISPTVSSGDSFRYRLSEPWRPPFYDSGTTVVPAGVISDTNIPADKYGIYQVAVYTYRLGVASADDGDIKTVNNERGGVSLAVDVAVNETPTAGDPIAALKGDDIILTATATVIPSAEYSFWRRDANGWVLIRDYAAGGSVTWTPNRVGLYTIQVRAKDAAGLTYEAAQNIEFNITDAVDTKAVVTDITINQATLDSDATARTPITITANAVSASEDLLYKFIISNGHIYYVETPYSVDPTYIWVPGKAGDYTISVLVKNRVSFGKYDAVGSFTVNVN